MEDKNIISSCCFHCNGLIQEKPWMTVKRNDITYNSCGYSCSVKLSSIIGSGYWKDVINKEDFNEPRPVFEIHKTYVKNDITVGSIDVDDIRDEIEEENRRIEQFEIDYVYSSSEEDNISEENYAY